MKKLQVLYIASESVPFSKTGGLADVAGCLPSQLQKLGCDVKVFLPYYKQTKEAAHDINVLRQNLSADLGQWDRDFTLRHVKHGKVDYYFIDKPSLYDRGGLYGEAAHDFSDNSKRFGFFMNAVIASSISLGFSPDIINCNDWQTALLPFYIKFRLQDCPNFRDTKTVFTIHNLAYQGIFSRDEMPGCGVGFDFFTPDALEFYGNFSFIKSGILYSDAVTTVSKGYAREILTEEFGCGLDGLLRSRQNALYGILNGADYNLWNPETDKHIIKGYTTEDPSGKKACKKDLLKSMGLPDDLSQPVLGVVSRLATQKGLDIIISAANELISMNTKLVVLGSGDDSYQSQLKNLAAAHPNNIAVRIGFDNALAHKIEAGCDMFLMPSRYEPCGLNQIYSLKYGTIPVVRATGGLDDTITDYSMDRKKGNGFKFPAATKDDFLNALNRALEVYRKKEEWSTLMKTGMEMDFSWAKSAKEYIKLYKKLLTEKK